MSYTLSRITIFSGVLPSLGLLTCVVYSIAYHADQSLRTHCHTDNYLPSISAAVGESSPEKQIWSLFLSISCALRLLLATGYLQELQTRFRWDRDGCLVSLHFGTSCVELFALFGLSVISSSDNFTIHRNCFAVFLSASLVYMILHLRVCFLLRGRQRLGERPLIPSRSFTIKLVSFGVYCLSTILAMYFYMRHQVHCERLMYTYFAATEYLVVFMNIIFHGTSYFDLSHVTVSSVMSKVSDSCNGRAVGYEPSRPWQRLGSVDVA